jgi:hypothetical protein
MATLTINFAKLLDGIPPGAWVAISEDHNRIVAYGADMRQVLSDAREKGEQRPLIVRVPERQGTLLL